MIVGLVLLATSIVVLYWGLAGPEMQGMDVVSAKNAITTSEFLIYGGLVFLSFGVLAMTALLISGAPVPKHTVFLYVVSVVVGAGFIALFVVSDGA